MILAADLTLLFVFRFKTDEVLMLSSRMDAVDGIPIQHIPLRVLKEMAKYLEIGTEHTWEFLAECMGLDVVTIMVSFYVFLKFALWFACDFFNIYRCGQSKVVAFFYSPSVCVTSH